MSKFARGFTGFLVFAAGQFFSLAGSGMSQFALGIWLWNETGSSTAFALVAFLAFAPRLVLAPLAGVVIDRVPRKLVLFVSDFAQGLGTVALLVLYSNGSLALWHIYTLVTILGAFSAFQTPAAATVVTSMVPKARYTQANGLRSLVDAGSQMLSPVLAGAVLGFSGGSLQLVFIIDLITMSIALTLLLLVHIPNPPRSTEPPRPLSSDLTYGFTFFARHRGLLHLTIAIAVLSFFAQAGFTVLGPLILSRTGGNELAYGLVSSAIGLGGIVGGAIVSVFGARLHGVRLLGMGLIAASLCVAAIGLGHTVLWWSITAAGVFVIMPTVQALLSTIFQRKVPAALQGRVFATQGMIITAGTTLSMLVAGPLADFVFEPGMNGGALTPVFAGLVGTGQGAGMSLMLVIGGVLSALGGVLVLANRAVRNIEQDIPDAEHAPVA